MLEKKGDISREEKRRKIEPNQSFTEGLESSRLNSHFETCFAQLPEEELKIKT